MKLARVSVLLMLVSTLLMIPLCRAEQTIIDHNVFQGQKGKITVTAYVYKDTGESVPDKDFYAFKIRVHSDDDFNYAKVSIYSPQGICDMWQPTQGAHGKGVISFSYYGIGFDIWIPDENVDVDNPYTHKITWEVVLTWTYTNDMDFAAGFYVPQGSAFEWTIDVEVKEFISQGILWTDTATWSTLPEPEPVGGTLFLVNKLELLAPYIVVSVVSVAAVVSVVLFKRRKKED